MSKINGKRYFFLFALLLLFVIAAVNTVYAEPLVEDWVARHTGNYSISYAKAIAVDEDGNVYITGTTSNMNLDFGTIKYSATGELLWAAYYNGPANSLDHAVAIALDHSGNIFVTGYSRGLFGTGTSYNNSYYDYATIKYDPDGNVLWVARYNGSGSNYDEPKALVVDEAGDVYVTGQSMNSSYWYDSATIKYDGEDGSELWSAIYNGSGQNNHGNDVAIDADGNIFVAGGSVGTGTNWDYFTAKYEGSSGNQLWVSRYNNTNNNIDVAGVVAVDNEGDVIVTGHSTGSNLEDYLTVKYDGSSGDQLWVKRYNGPGNGRDIASAIAVDSDDNVVITGQSKGSGSDLDYSTIKYSGNDGSVVWVDAARYNGPGNYEDIATAVAVDSSGDIYVTGYSYTENNVIRSLDYATVKYSGADGAEQWAARYNGPDNREDRAAAIVVDSGYKVYITGSSTTPSGTASATIKYSQTSIEPPPVEYTHKVLYLPVRFSDTSQSPQPTRSIADLWLWAEMTSRYYRLQSYGQVEIENYFISDDWIYLDKTLDEYRKEAETIVAEDRFDDSWKSYTLKDKIDFITDFLLIEDAMAKGNLIEPGKLIYDNYADWSARTGDTEKNEEERYYDIVAIVQAGHNTSYQGLSLSGVGLLALNDIYGCSIWAHELGHGIEAYKDFYGSGSSAGDISRWGLMGLGARLNPGAPIISYNKLKSGWLSGYRSISLDTIENVKLLQDMRLGDEVIKYEPTKGKVDYFIIEGRNPPDGNSIYNPWHANKEPAILIEEKGLLLYKVLESEGKTSLYTIPNHDLLLMLNPLKSYNHKVTLVPGDTYIDLPSQTKFTATQVGSQLYVQVEEYDIFNTLIIDIFVPQISWPFLIQPLGIDIAPMVTENEFDIDLKLWSSDGLMVGMDYDNFKYIVEIPDARTSGNIGGGGPEWISVPASTEIYYEVDTTPVERWLHELVEKGMLDAEELLDLDLEIEVVIQEIVVDADGVRNEVDKTIVVGDYDFSLWLDKGWNLLSLPRWMEKIVYQEPYFDAWMAYKDGVWITGDKELFISELNNPSRALFVNVNEPTLVRFNWDELVPGNEFASQELSLGWNLISSGIRADHKNILSDLFYNGTSGLTQLFAPNSYNGRKSFGYSLPWENPLVSLATQAQGSVEHMYPLDGYWVYLRGAGVTYSTPVGSDLPGKVD
jgi:hypothetical protein